MNQDTIAAISTGMTNSGIGIVRISGSEALEIADRVYKGKETITEVPTHTIHYGHVMDGDETVDEVLVMVMRGPRTFTGEDTVEINCHGGTYVVSRVLETVLKAGARPAEPGEFYPLPPRNRLRLLQLRRRPAGRDHRADDRHDRRRIHADLHL